MRVKCGYASLGIRPVVNASATLTRLGGSLMPMVVREAMAEAANCFVDIVELQGAVGARLAELTHNDAAYVTCGAAAGITHAVAACIAGTDAEQISAFPHIDGAQRREVIVFRRQRNGYDYAARQTGARFVEVADGLRGLEAALSERTACVLCFAGAHFGADVAMIARLTEVAHSENVPVIVDAAAQIPPRSSLWDFTSGAGADAVIISGGKGLRGPQSSGMVLGNRSLISACQANGSPNFSIGRPMKVGKEEMIGLLAAVEWYLEQDETSMIKGYEESVRLWIEGLSGIPEVNVSRGYPSEAGQPYGRAIVQINTTSAVTRDEIVQRLWTGEPRIAVGLLGDDAIALNAQTLDTGEDEVVLWKLRQILE